MYRKLQGNGSISIPAQMRRSLGLEPGDALELEVQQNGDILLKGYYPKCTFCESTKNLQMVKGVRMCLGCYDKLRKDDKDADK